MDCFYVGRLAGSKGVVWQYTAIDVASAYTWAFLRQSEHNPSARHTAELAHLVAAELRAAGWRLGEVTTDNGSEFRAAGFSEPSPPTGATQRKIKAGTTELKRLRRAGPADDPRGVLAAGLLTLFGAAGHRPTPRPRGYLRYYNLDRAHTGRLTKGRVPADIVFGARKMASVR